MLSNHLKDVLFHIFCQLNSRAGCELSMYVELRESSKYAEYVIFSFLACPGLLFHAEGRYNDLFKLVLSDHLVLDVFRDVVCIVFFCTVFI